MAQGILPDTSQPATIGDLNVDVMLEREVTFDSEITEYPVEDGFPVSDHVTRKPMKLSLTVVCTPTPVVGNASQSRMNDVANAIQKMYKAAEPITVKTADAIYENMVLTHAPLPLSVSNGYCYKMQVDLVQVRKAQAKSEDVPEGSTASEASAMSGTTEKDMGQASQQNIGTGFETIENTSVVEVNTKPYDGSVGGNINTGMEQTAMMAAEMIVGNLVGRAWRA